MNRFSSIETSRKILSEYKTFAVVGCSSSPHRPSFGVARFLNRVGYNVVPVNPFESECQGWPCFENLASIPDNIEVEVVDIFRRSEFAGAHVDEAIERGAKAVWLQLGVIDEAACERAAGAGLDVVMDRCPAIDYPRLFGRR